MNGMSFAPLYLLNRFFFRIADFFHHWYVDGSRSILHGFVSFLENLDRTFAVAVTARHLLEPLYGDRGVVAHVLGLVFRSLRVLLGVLTYLVLGFLMLAVFLLWLALPFGILFLVYREYIISSR